MLWKNGSKQLDMESRCKCKYSDCYSTISITMFRVPKDARRPVWEKHSGQTPLNNNDFLCYTHFYQSDIKEYSLKKNLKSTAFPKSCINCPCDENGLKGDCAKLYEQALKNSGTVDDVSDFLFSFHKIFFLSGRIFHLF